jgi:KDO2-lipid IV(A) lauroyltransferase
MVFWWLITTSKLIGPKSVRFYGTMMGMLFYRLSRRYRELVKRQLLQVFGDTYTPEERDRLTRQVFIHFTSEAYQFFRVVSMKPEAIDKMVEGVGLENVDNALAGGKGCIVVTAHFGNWEMLGRKLVRHGCAVNVIARDSDDPGMTGIATKVRESGGYGVFDKDQPIIGAFRKLKNNEVLGILPDQNDYDGIEVEFFGRTALTAVGPAVLSLKSGAPIVPAFCEKIGDDKYRLTAYPSITYTPTGEQEADVKNLTQLVMHALEDGIRLNPSQWLWLHDRWKTKTRS